MMGVVEKIIHFFGHMALHVSALFLVCLFLVVIIYAITRLCAQQPVIFHLTWITVTMAGLCAVVALFNLLPIQFQFIVARIIIPQLLCAILLHTVILALNRFMNQCIGHGMIPTRIVLLITIIYIFFMTLSLVLIYCQHAFMTQLFNLVTNYLTKIGLVALLVFEVLAGRCKRSTLGQSGYSDSNEGGYL
jgi:hypothetical protein